MNLYSLIRVLFRVFLTDQNQAIDLLTERSPPYKGVECCKSYVAKIAFSSFLDVLI